MVQGRSSRLVVAAALAATVLGVAGASSGVVRATPPPTAITSCGQSPDALTVSLLSRRMQIDHVFESAMHADRLAGVRTLVVVVGGSVKGLSEAGSDEQRESARVASLLARARELSIRVIGVHVGGESRRGALSDRFIDLVASSADYLIVTEPGNFDGFFSRVARDRQIPLVIVSRSADIGRELRTLVPGR